MATRIASRTGEGTKETNVSETGHDRQARRRLCETMRTKECKYGFACPKRGLCDATNSHRVTRAAEIAAVSRADRCLGEADCAGLRPEDVLVYGEKCAEESEAFGRKVAQQRRSRPQGPAAQGRKNRPYQKASTVGRKNDAHCQGTNGIMRCKMNTARQLLIRLISPSHIKIV